MSDLYEDLLGLSPVDRTLFAYRCALRAEDVLSSAPASLRGQFDLIRNALDATVFEQEKEVLESLLRGAIVAQGEVLSHYHGSEAAEDMGVANYSMASQSAVSASITAIYDHDMLERLVGPYHLGPEGLAGFSSAEAMTAYHNACSCGIGWKPNWDESVHMQALRDLASLAAQIAPRDLGVKLGHLGPLWESK